MNSVSQETIPINQVQPVRTTRFYNWMIDLVYKIRGVAFDSFEEYFPAGSSEEKLHAPYPSVLMANHVSEADIPALAAVYRHVWPKIKFAIPAREDMLGKGFLVNELRPKGIMKLFLKMVDATMLIPKFMDYIGCVPIKRPFRDNARELLKKGELRDMVEQEWSFLSEKIAQGRTLFLFPEGTFNHDGYLNQIKKGIYFLRSKFKGLHFNSFTFTYDYFSSKKAELHIGYGDLFPIPEEAGADEVAGIVREKLGKGYAVTTGNLASYLLLKCEGKAKESKTKLLGALKALAETIRAKHPEIYISRRFFEDGLAAAFDSFLHKSKEKGYLKLDGEYVVFDEKLFHPPKEIHNLKKKNLILYHRNQLTFHLPKLEAAWSGLQTV